MKIRPVGAKLFQTDGRTDTTKVTVALRNSGNTPKKYLRFIFDIFLLTRFPLEKETEQVASNFLLRTVRDRPR